MPARCKLEDAATTADKIAVLKREIALRRRVYPRMIEQRKMTRQIAEKQIAVLQAILRDYETRAAVTEAFGRPRDPDTLDLPFE